MNQRAGRRAHVIGTVTVSRKMLLVSELESAQHPTLNRAETPVRHAAQDQHRIDRAAGEDEKRYQRTLARTLSEVVSVEVWLVSGDKDSHREVAVASSPADSMDQDRV